MFFKNITEKHTFSKLRRAVTLNALSRNIIIDLMHSVVAEIVELAERYELSGDLWETFFALQLAWDENSLGHTAEHGGDVKSGSLFYIASRELWGLHRIVTAARKMIASEDAFESLRPLADYTPVAYDRITFHPEEREAVLNLAKNIAATRSPEEMMEALIEFYRVNGSGIFALQRAYRWDSDHGLRPVVDLDPQTLESLVGYESQKAELLANTELFLRGGEANNVLLFGDSGTGKSSSVRALLNEPEFVARGLRMIELRKDQFADIPKILDQIRERNYKFILFMDDLSFEEFEVEYKYLKALIEGGLERKPANTLIYATSNRRNLVREVWKDRTASSDDVHGRDTMQEKLSLADRFGITIWYGPADKTQYMDIVKSIAEDFGISMEEAELEKLALRWEIGKGGFTGRAARQFVQHLLLLQEEKEEGE